MKVIVQDIATKLFLSEEGAWVPDGTDARNFFTLLRAYHFATDKLLSRFRIMLHCPEDGYTSCIIEGEGGVEMPVTAKSSAPAPKVKKTAFSRNHDCTTFGGRFNYQTNLDETRNRLN